MQVGETHSGVLGPTRLSILKSLPTAMLQGVLITVPAPAKTRFARLADRSPQALPNSILCSAATDTPGRKSG